MLFNFTVSGATSQNLKKIDSELMQGQRAKRALHWDRFYFKIFSRCWLLNSKITTVFGELSFWSFTMFIKTIGLYTKLFTFSNKYKHKEKIY